MYTEPHVETRSVWMRFSVGGESSQLRLWPESEAMTIWRDEVSLKGRIALGKITSAAEYITIFPAQDGCA